MRAVFPAELSIGVATSATQIEGHSPPSDWLRFAREPGRVRGGDTPEVACDHWHRFRDDLALLPELAAQVYRFSVEWARLEPRPGEFDDEAFERYRTLLGTLQGLDVEPYLTLHHFTLPLWVAERGGLLCRELPALLERLAREVARRLGDLCARFITINEPNVVCAQGFMNGEWPPGKKGDLASFIRAQRSLLEAHVRMYRALHEEEARMPAPCQVGVAHHLRVVEPERPGRLGDRLAAAAMNAAFNEAFANAVTDGEMTLLDPLVRAAGGFDPREARGTQDFFGLNYYSRDKVSLRWSARDAGFVHRAVPEGQERSDLGWELYPEGLHQLITTWSARSGLPVVITENGIADASDEQRPSFLVRHLDAVCRAASSGARVAGYCYWSLLDNFEWAEGYAPRFGLYAVDYATQVRTARPSAALFRALAQEGGISDGMWARYGAPGPA